MQRSAYDTSGFYTLCLPLFHPSFTFCVSDYREDCVLKSQWWVDIALQHHQSFDIHRISTSITGTELLKLFCQTLPVHVTCSQFKSAVILLLCCTNIKYRFEMLFFDISITGHYTSLDLLIVFDIYRVSQLSLHILNRNTVTEITPFVAKSSLD